MNTRISPSSNMRQVMIFAAAAAIFFMLMQFGFPSKTFDVRNVSVSEAKQMIADGAVVVDVRGPESFKGRHIPGAISLPLAMLRTAVPASLAFAKTKSVVVYCGDGVSIGPEGTALLNQAGFAQAVNLQSGIQGWADAGLPVKSNGAGVEPIVQAERGPHTTPVRF